MSTSSVQTRPELLLPTRCSLKLSETLGIFGFTSTPQDALKHITLGAPVGKSLKQLQFVAAVCNAASFDKADSELPLNQRRIHGDATDSAVLRVAEEIHGLEKANEGWEKKYQLSFNSKVSSLDFVSLFSVQSLRS